MNEEQDSLYPFDPEIERTLLRRRRKLKENSTEEIEDSEMGDQQKILLRDLWIPKGQSVSSGIVSPVVQANNFELKPALSTAFTVWWYSS